MNIKIYGTGTSGHQMVYATLESYLKNAHIEFELEEISDVDEFLRMRIESIPAIVVENRVVYTIKQNEGFNFSLRKAVFQILKEKDFGRLTKVLIPIDFSESSINSFYYCQRLLTGKMAIIKLINIEQPSEIVDAIKLKDTQQVRKDKLHDFGVSLSQDWSNELIDGPLIETEYKECITQKDTVANAIIDDISLIILNSNESINQFHIEDTSVLIVPPKARFKGIKKALFFADHPFSITEDLVQIFGLILQPTSIIYIMTPFIVENQIRVEIHNNLPCEIVYIQEQFEPINILNKIDELNSEYVFDLISYCRTNKVMASLESQSIKFSKLNSIPFLVL